MRARPSCCADGWTPDAAEAVRATGDDPAGVLDGIAVLLDQQLIQRGAGTDGTTRFGILETIREYAAERLGASPEQADATRRRRAGALPEHRATGLINQGEKRSFGYGLRMTGERPPPLCHP